MKATKRNKIPQYTGDVRSDMGAPLARRTEVTSSFTGYIEENKTFILSGAVVAVGALAYYAYTLYLAATTLLEFGVDTKRIYVWFDPEKWTFNVNIYVWVKNKSNINFKITKPLIYMGVENKEIANTGQSKGTLKEYNIKPQQTTDLGEFGVSIGIMQMVALLMPVVKNISSLVPALVAVVPSLWSSAVSNGNFFTAIPTVSEKVAEILLTKGIKIQYKYLFSYYLFGFFPINLGENKWQNAY